jgi:uncharacterized protein YcfJ
MSKRIIVLAAAMLAGSGALPLAASAQTSTDSQQDTKRHEMECTAATVGGAVIGAAVGSVFGGGLGRTLFEAGGAGLGVAAGRHLKCGK